MGCLQIGKGVRQGCILSPCLFNWAFLIAQLVKKNPPTMQEAPVKFLGQEDLLEKGIGYPLQYSWASLVVQLVKNSPAVWET